jgi:predicted dehydrogenase
VPGAVVVGTGFGCRVHVPALRNAGFDVVALVGRNKDRTTRRAERVGVPTVCTSLRTALELPNADAVTVATPPDTHAPLTIEACEARRHVICEKPFALDRIEASQMLAAAARAHVTHLVGHEFRWAPERALVARALDAGAIGEPRTFSLVEYVPLVSDPETPMPSWWFDPARGGGWLGASGSHVVDQVHTWFGEIASVSASLPRVGARRNGAEDSFVVRLSTVSGVHGVLQQTAASWTAGAVGVSIVAGTEGTIEVTADGVWLSNRGRRQILPIPDDLALPASSVATDDPRERFTHLELGPYTRLCEAFRAGVAAETDATTAVPVPTFADGLAEMRVLDAIRASAAADGAATPITG